MSLVEISLVSVVLVIMSAVIVQSLRSLSMTQSFIAEQTKVASLSERTLAAVESDVTYTMRLFAENDLGRAHLAAMELDGRTPLGGSRMPVPVAKGVFEADPVDAVQTGNLLFMARSVPHLLIDAGDGGTPDLLRVDAFRFVAWFLGPGPVTGVDLSRWSSVRVARWQDANAIADVDRRARLLRGLHEAGVRFIWDPNLDPADAFQSIEPDGSLAPRVGKLPGDPLETELDIFGRRHLGIAANGSTAIDVPKYAKAKATFPHGFEVKQDGDGSGGLLLVRLVGATRGGGEHRVAAAEAMRQTGFRQE